MTGENAVPRPEYPRPQMVRGQWLNLNGEWEFATDFGKSGKERRLHEADRLEGKIIVPFCPESELSGIGYKDFIPAVWYRKEFTLPQEWAGKRVLLHFGAVDYETEVWVNGQAAGKHRGGYTPFTFEVTSLVRPGTNAVTVYAVDDVRSGLQPAGKQSRRYESHGCHYTRTTGIWQTVWLECVPRTYLSSLRMTPDPDNGCIHVEAQLNGNTAGGRLELEAFYEGRAVGAQTVKLAGPAVCAKLPLSEIHLWEPGHGRLYDLRLTVRSGSGEDDVVESYFGLRTIRLDGRKILINGKPVFQRLVLDQGFYPDGIYTAPSDEALRRDIEIAIGLGFNGARLHQKIFEPRFLYWADRLGYLVWGEHASWGLDISGARGLEQFLPEWLEAVERDYNHPALVGWCPFNETSEQQDDEVLRIVYRTTKMLDRTRPVIDTSGYVHVVTDIYDVHDYDQNPESFALRYEPLKEGGQPFVNRPKREKYEGQPYFVSEYGGIWWNPGQTDAKAWGYGARPQSEEEFLTRYEKLTNTLLTHPNICAFCYTQLYDVEQEVNGLYTYDRRPKFDPEVIRRINTARAAIESTELNTESSVRRNDE